MTSADFVPIKAVRLIFSIKLKIKHKKCSDILYQSIFKQFKTKIFLVIQRSMLADDYIPDIFPELSGFQHGDRSLRTPK